MEVTNKRCDACALSNREGAGNDGGHQYSCRKNPPTPFYIGNNSQGIPMIYGAFAPVQATAWCDSFELPPRLQ